MNADERRSKPAKTLGNLGGSKSQVMTVGSIVASNQMTGVCVSSPAPRNESAALRFFAPVPIDDKPGSALLLSRHRLAPLHTTIAVAPPSRFPPCHSPYTEKADLDNSRVARSREYRS